MKERRPRDLQCVIDLNAATVVILLLIMVNLPIQASYLELMNRWTLAIGLSLGGDTQSRMSQHLFTHRESIMKYSLFSLSYSPSCQRPRFSPPALNPRLGPKVTPILLPCLTCRTPDVRRAGIATIGLLRQIKHHVLALVSVGRPVGLIGRLGVRESRVRARRTRRNKRRGGADKRGVKGRRVGRTRAV